MIIDKILEKQKSNKEIKEIEDSTNIYDYLDEEKWHNLTIDTKKYLIEKICILESKELDIKEMPQIKYFSTQYRIGGFYRNIEKTIYLNEKMLLDENGYEEYGVLIHELTHVNQHEDTSDILYDIYLRNPILTIKFSIFNNMQGNFHIDAIQEILDKSDIFYHLTKPEREAYCAEFNKRKDKNKQDKLDEYYSEFKKIYKCDLKNDEINKIIDNAFLNIYKQTTYYIVDKNIELSVMYDLCVIAIFLETKDVEIINYLMDSAKEKALQEYKIDLIQKKNDKYSLNEYLLEKDEIEEKEL